MVTISDTLFTLKSIKVFTTDVMEHKMKRYKHKRQKPKWNVFCLFFFFFWVIDKDVIYVRG